VAVIHTEFQDGRNTEECENVAFYWCNFYTRQNECVLLLLRIYSKFLSSSYSAFSPKFELASPWKQVLWTETLTYCAELCNVQHSYPRSQNWTPPKIQRDTPNFDRNEFVSVSLQVQRVATPTTRLRSHGKGLRHSDCACQDVTSVIRSRPANVRTTNFRSVDSEQSKNRTQLTQ